MEAAGEFINVQEDARLQRTVARDSGAAPNPVIGDILSRIHKKGNYQFIIGENPTLYIFLENAELSFTDIFYPTADSKKELIEGCRDIRPVDYDQYADPCAIKALTPGEDGGVGAYQRATDRWIDRSVEVQASSRQREEAFAASGGRTAFIDVAVRNSGDVDKARESQRKILKDNQDKSRCLGAPCRWGSDPPTVREVLINMLLRFDQKLLTNEPAPGSVVQYEGTRNSYTNYILPRLALFIYTMASGFTIVADGKKQAYSTINNHLRGVDPDDPDNFFNKYIAELMKLKENLPGIFTYRGSTFTPPSDIEIGPSESRQFISSSLNGSVALRFQTPGIGGQYQEASAGVSFNIYQFTDMGVGIPENVVSQWSAMGGVEREVIILPGSNIVTSLCISLLDDSKRKIFQALFRNITEDNIATIHDFENVEGTPRGGEPGWEDVVLFNRQLNTFLDFINRDYAIFDQIRQGVDLLRPRHEGKAVLRIGGIYCHPPYHIICYRVGEENIGGAVVPGLGGGGYKNKRKKTRKRKSTKRRRSKKKKRKKSRKNTRKRH